MAGTGGHRPGAGRKPKDEQLKMIEKLSPLQDSAFEALKAKLKAKDMNAVKLFMEYMYGKPKQQIDANVTGALSIIWNEEKTYLND